MLPYEEQDDSGTHHEVETGHEQDKVDKQQPVLLQSHPPLGDESTSHIAVGLSDRSSLRVGFGFRETEAEDDNEDRWTRAKPKERSPAVGGGADESASEHCCHQVAKCVSLLQHS